MVVLEHPDPRVHQTLNCQLGCCDLAADRQRRPKTWCVSGAIYVFHGGSSVDIPLPRVFQASFLLTQVMDESGLTIPNQPFAKVFVHTDGKFFKPNLPLTIH